MKNLTANQQQTIDNLMNEFSRINSSTKKTSGYNILNIEPLKQENEEIKQNELIAHKDQEMWRKIAMDEAQRIVELLSEDMPFACVERYGESNGHYDLPYITIQREKGRYHCDNMVVIGVKVIKKREQQTHNCYYDKGIGLCYTHQYSLDNTEYSSIEELFEKSQIKEYIRKRIL